MKKLLLDDYVFKLPDNETIIEETLFEQAFNVENGINHLYKALGWQGGTIHQIKDKIMEYKRKWNAGTARLKQRIKELTMEGVDAQTYALGGQESGSGNALIWA